MFNWFRFLVGEHQPDTNVPLPRIVEPPKPTIEQPGQKVALRVGGPQMVISQFHETDMPGELNVLCSWFDARDKLHCKWFSEETLILVEN